MYLFFMPSASNFAILSQSYEKTREMQKESLLFSISDPSLHYPLPLGEVGQGLQFFSFSIVYSNFSVIIRIFPPRTNKLLLYDNS